MSIRYYQIKHSRRRKHKINFNFTTTPLNEYLNNVRHESSFVEILARDRDCNVSLGRVVCPHCVQLLLHVFELTLVLKRD